VTIKYDNFKIMKIKHTILWLLVLLISFSGCNKNADYLVEKGKVGKINKETTVNELTNLFVNDSLVVNLSKAKPSKDNEKKYFHEDDEYVVYNKEGKLLLTIIPLKQNDSSSTIKSVEIFNNKYKTKKGISLFSPYKDINTAYQLSITNTLLSAHIDIDELNATMTIDKKEIGINEFNRDKIKTDQIPDLARIKHFTIWFN